MNPLGVLTAADIMVPLDRSRSADRPFAATARPETPVREVMQAVAKNNGDVGVVDKGAILGMISADDIVRGLLKHQETSFCYSSSSASSSPAFPAGCQE